MCKSGTTETSLTENIRDNLTRCFKFFLIRKENISIESDKGIDAVGGQNKEPGCCVFKNSATGFKLFQARCLVENNHIMIAIL